jgi:NADH-quinone oxidoreductase E subunit
MYIEFNSEEIKEVNNYISKYPEKKAAIMPVLWLAQKKWGWISPDVIVYIGQLLNLPVSHVEGVASFYTMYFKKPMGKYHVQVCTNVSCMLRKGDEIFAHVSEKFGIKHNDMTEDGLFSLEEVECMGACGGAPMIAINEDFYECVDIRKVDDLIDNLKNI